MEETLIKETKVDYSAVLRRALDLGEMVLMSGGEVGRVEDTVSRICYAYGADRVDVLTITSSIIVTVIPPKGDAITQTRRIGSKGFDLTRLDALNQLSRQVCMTRPAVEEIDERLREISRMRRIPWLMLLISEVIIASGFTLFFGGSWYDALATIFVAVAIFVLERIRNNIHINKIVYFLISSFIAGAVAVFAVRLGMGHNVNAIMIGAIMLLIPGIAITSAFEDLLTGDTITGLLQLCESVIIAVSIAVGFAIATFICCGYDMLNDGTCYIDPWIQLGAAFFTTGGFAVVFGIRRMRRLLPASIGGLLTQGVFLLLSLTGMDSVIALLLSAIAGAIYAQIMARVMHAPATIFSLMTIIPLVPGSSLYYTMSWALRGNIERFTARGVSTLLSALAIAFGLMSVLVMTGGVTAMIRKIKIRKLFK